MASISVVPGMVYQAWGSRRVTAFTQLHQSCFFQTNSWPRKSCHCGCHLMLGWFVGYPLGVIIFHPCSVLLGSLLGSLRPLPVNLGLIVRNGYEPLQVSLSLWCWPSSTSMNGSILFLQIHRFAAVGHANKRTHRPPVIGSGRRVQKFARAVAAAAVWWEGLYNRGATTPSWRDTIVDDE